MSLRAISSLSSLTDVQLETLELHLALKRNELTMEEALKKRKISGISRGSHYRILGQAKHNIRQSMFTLAIATRLRLVKEEEVQKFVASVMMIPTSLDAERIPDVLALLSALAERIVTSS